jgi:hypothetical protein
MASGSLRLTAVALVVECLKPPLKRHCRLWNSNEDRKSRPRLLLAVLAMAYSDKRRLPICRIPNLTAQTSTGQFWHFSLLWFLRRMQLSPKFRSCSAPDHCANAPQRLRFLQIARVEPLSEPPVNRSQQFARLAHLALVAPEACEASWRRGVPRIWLVIGGRPGSAPDHDVHDAPTQGCCTSSRRPAKVSRQFCRRSYSRSQEPYRLYAVAVWIADKSRVVSFVIVHAYAWIAVRCSAFTAQTCATDRSLPRPKGARSEYGTGVRPPKARPFQGSPYAEPLRPTSPRWLVHSLSENELWATAESSAVLQSTKVVAVGLGPGCSTRAT